MGTYSGTVTTGIILTNPTLQNPATITATGYVTNTNTVAGDAVYGNNAAAWTLSNFGTVVATADFSNGVNFLAGGLVVNGESAVIIGPNGVQITGTAGTVLNAGTIVSTDEYAVRLDNGGTVNNVPGTAGSAQIIGGNAGVLLLSGGGTVNNGASGFSAATITGATYGVWSRDLPATVTNYGTITGTAGSGVFLYNGGVVTNASSGVVSSSNRGIDIRTGAGSVDNAGIVQSTYGAISMASGGVTNRQGGTIAGSGGVGIGQGTVVNLGTIIGNGTTGFGVIFSTGGSVENGSTSVTDALISGTLRGVQIYNAAGNVTNFGTIAASITYAAAVYLHGGGIVTNLASGVIDGGGIGIVVANTAGAVINFGSVIGTSGSGVILGAGGTASNSGSIHGGAYGITGSGTVFNSGIITGGNVGVRLTAGTVTNSGSISGGLGTAVSFGAGNDRLVLQAGFGFTGNLYGGLGTDTLELDGSGGALIANYNALGLTAFENILFGAGDNATLIIGNPSGIVGATISDFDATTETIDLTGIGSDGQVTNHDTVTNRVTIAGSLGSVTLQLTDANDGTPFATAPDGGGGTNFTIACFCRGTRIRTPSGEVPVEKLAIGDEVITLSGRSRPIKWIGRRAYDPRFVRGNRNILPVRVRAGALAAGVPARDLLISPEHALYLDGLFLPARHLVNGVTIRQPARRGNIEYFHIELDSHDVIFAEGAAAETFVAFGGRGMFHNGVEFVALYPHDEPPDWPPYEALLERGNAGLSGVRARLLARAERLGMITRDPDLHLLVDGATVRALSIDGGIHRFALPANADDVRIASRSVVPAEMEVGSPDRRRLGVPVRRIVLCGAGRRFAIGPGCAQLRDGFHADEESHRWTDGDALLPPEVLAVIVGDLTLEVEIATTELRYPIGPPSTGAERFTGAQIRPSTGHRLTG